MLRIALAFVALALFAGAAVFAVPAAIEARSMLAAEDEPAAIADRALARSFNADVAVREIEAALAANDADLAKSFLDLAVERNLAIPATLAERVNADHRRANSTAAYAENFARGLITGEPDNAVSLAGTALGDLFVFGDVRDAVREGSRYISGEQIDEWVLGLSLVGIAATAGTYASFGAASPVRVGVSVAKVARKAGAISARMAGWIGRSLRDAVDISSLKRAGTAVAEPAVAVRVAREAVKIEKARDLARLAGDVGRIQTRAGTKAAVDALKLAQGPRDMARIAKLAEKKGSKTRAILKFLGRGAIFLAVSSFNLALWIFSAVLTLIGLIASAKSGAERLTQRALDRRRKRRNARYLAMTEARA